MRVIIAGTRDLRDADKFLAVAIAHSGFCVTEVVSGHSGAVDLAGEKWATRLGVKLTTFPAHWRDGKRAGPERNERMASYCDAYSNPNPGEQLTVCGLVALLVGESRGTVDMISRATAHGLYVYLLPLPDVPYLHAPLIPPERYGS